MAFGRGRQRGKIRNEPNRDPPIVIWSLRQEIRGIATPEPFVRLPKKCGPRNSKLFARISI